MHGLGANQTERAMTRVGKALGTLYPLLSQFDRDNEVHEYSACRSIPSAEKDRDMIINQLQKSRSLSNLPSRKHSTFSKPRDVLHAMDHSDLKQWMSECM